MSVRVMTHVFENAEASGNDRVVLLVLADHAHDDGAGAYPGQATIARKARIAPRTVRDCLKRLEAAGEIERTGERRGRTRQLIEYRVTVTRQELPPSERRQPGATTPADSDRKAADSDTERRRPSADEPSLEPSEEPSGEPSVSDAFGADAAKLASQLEAKVNEIAETPGRERVGKRWVQDIERLLRIDGRTVKQVAYVIDWLGGPTEGGQFWGSNVQSGAKLRGKFDQLVARIKTERRNGRGPSSAELRQRAQAARSAGR